MKCGLSSGKKLCKKGVNSSTGSTACANSFFFSNCLDEITASSYWLNGDILSFVLESYGKIVFRELN